MKMRLNSVAAVLLLTAAGAAVAQANPAIYRRDIPASLAADARISEDAARATAVRKVPGGQVRSVELEREAGQLIYSFDIEVPGKALIDEVHISAIDGRLLSVTHESVRKERAEAAAEKKAAGENP